MHKHNWSFLCQSEKEKDIHFVCFLRFHGTIGTVRSLSTRDLDKVRLAEAQGIVYRTTLEVGHRAGMRWH